jgi:hypothetical protein
MMMSKPSMSYTKFNIVSIVFLVSFIVLDTTHAEEILPFLSVQCASESEFLLYNTTVEDKFPDISFNCTLEVGMNSECTNDYAKFSSDYRNACKKAGGQFLAIDILSDCSGIVNGVTYNGKYNELNVPYCVGTSCTESEVDVAFERSLSAADFEENDFTCTFASADVSGAGTMLNFNIQGAFYIVASMIVASATVIVM